eukprot:gb/GEZJ01009554.1/.p1 GENE.gb/GEZJ01009554.1/~~gb/GEZJ01009554.1/.p1  ORF type:complete len:126 (+),score=17.59 gb/GEZJ01009554.1/:153-530(+)
MTQMIELFNLEHIPFLDAEKYVFVGRLALSLDHARSCQGGLGPFILLSLDSLEEGVCNDGVRSVALMFIQAASEISDIVSERYFSNQAATELQTMLPMQLVKINMRSFVGIMNQHMNRLSHSFSN